MLQSTTGLLDVNFPIFYPVAHKPMYQVDPSSLPAFLGMGYHSGRFSAENASFPVNLIPYLMYYDIFRHYYANRQEVFYNVMTANWGTNDKRVSFYDLAKLDDLYMSLPYSGGNMTSNTSLAQTPITGLFSIPANSSFKAPFMTVPLGGLWQACYMPDRMNVILNDIFFKNNVTTVTVSTVGDSFQVDQLVTAKNSGILETMT